jgi:hypothetical protein
VPGAIGIGEERYRPSSMRRTWLAAAVLSGVPSTVWALASGRSVLESTRAAGTLLGRPSVVRGVTAHLAISLGWTWVLVRIGVRSPLTGAAAGGAIAALDLGFVGRRIPAIAALPVLPQVADHLAFGAVVGWCNRKGASRLR